MQRDQRHLDGASALLLFCKQYIDYMSVQTMGHGSLNAPLDHPCCMTSAWYLHRNHLQCSGGWLCTFSLHRTIFFHAFSRYLDSHVFVFWLCILLSPRRRCHTSCPHGSSASSPCVARGCRKTRCRGLKMEHGRGTQTGIVCLWRYANTKAQKRQG